MIILLIVLYCLVSLCISIVFKRLESRRTTKAFIMIIVWAFTWPLWSAVIIYFLIKGFADSRF